MGEVGKVGGARRSLVKYVTPDLHDVLLIFSELAFLTTASPQPRTRIIVNCATDSRDGGRTMRRVSKVQYNPACRSTSTGTVRTHTFSHSTALAMMNLNFVLMNFLMFAKLL
jgi:hypothetical protein